VTLHPGPQASDDDAHEDDLWIADDAFAGLIAIDVVDGELVPRRSRPRR
jgi:hypothetical protein